MNFPHAVWSMADTSSGPNLLRKALANASATIADEAGRVEVAPPSHDDAASIVTADFEDIEVDIEAGNPELALHLETMVDGVGDLALRAVDEKSGNLEKFAEIDSRNTLRIDEHIANLIGQEAAISHRIERDVLLLLRTRKTRMAQEAASRILHSDDDAVIALLQSDPLNTAEGAVKIAKDGATTEGGTKIPFRRTSTVSEEGENQTHKSEGGE